MHRRVAWIVAILSVLSAGSAEAQHTQLVLAGLTSPLYITHSRDGTGRLFVVEQAGIIKVVPQGSASPTVFLDIRSRVLSGGERGLLGLAFHPQYASNRLFYVFYTQQPDGALAIAELQATASDPNAASTAERRLLTIPHPVNANHNGGMIEFGPDGLLYIGTGDGGGANDPPSNAQNVNSLLGKILRVDVTPPAAARDALMTAFYENVLLRSPGAGELTGWTDFLRTNCSTGGVQAIARGFFGSGEYAQRQLSVAGHVAVFYRTLLGRDPDPAGLAAWSGVLRQARLQVALGGFIPSAEFRAMLPDRTNRAAVEAVLGRFYTQILGRQADPEGLTAWTDFVVATGNLEAAAAGFLASPEFEARPLSLPEYVGILYQAFLGRGPDPAGLAAWQAVLQAAIAAIVETGFAPAAELDIAGLCGNAPYRIPDNPFVGGAGADEIFAYGLRNPFRFSFDRGTGDLVVGDVGQNLFEEIDIVTRGANMGWRVFEGFSCTGNDPALCDSLGSTPPIAAYGHTNGRCSITGGYVYRGQAGFPAAGAYVFGDFCTGEIFTRSGTGATVLLDTPLSISSFGEDEAGELYVVDLNGAVHRLVD